MSSANRFGQIFQVTTFGESHGAALGCVIDGCPAGVPVSKELLQKELDRRRPGQNAWTSARQEADEVEILSGVHEGKSLGTPIAVIIRNRDARSQDYQPIEAALAKGETPRAGHADDLWRAKFGHSDLRGGGRSSGRETVARVAAGAIAKSVVRSIGEGKATRVLGFASEIAGISLSADDRQSVLVQAAEYPADLFAARFPSPSQVQNVEAKLVAAVSEGRSYGGIGEIVILGAPKSLGQPVFHKLKSDLAAAYFGVGATSGVEIGDGFSAASEEGTQFHSASNKKPADESATDSVYGGIRGGISTGEPIVVRVAFKPTSTVMDLAKRGRHDPCIVPRALPVLEAMTWLVLCDHLLWRRLDQVGSIV